MKKRDVYGYLISICAAELVGLMSSLVSGAGNGYYESLIHPPLAPPGWVFPVVWTFLYALMGIASYSIYNSTSEQKSGAMALYVLQLGVNFLWPIVFFKLQLPGAAIAVLILLIVLVVLMILQFYKVKKSAAWLMVPYLLWLLFALYLNIGIYFLNP